MGDTVAANTSSAGITAGLGSNASPTDILGQAQSQANEAIQFQAQMSDINRAFQMNRAYYQFRDAMSQAIAGIMQTQSQQLGRAG